MGTVSMGPAGAVGINTDLSPAELPPEAWSGGRNIQFASGAASSTSDTSVLVPVTPLQFNSAIPGPMTSSGYASWLLGGNTEVHAYIAGAMTEVTRAAGDYTGASTNRWSGGALGGVTVINNGADVPQGWLVAAPSQLLIDLPNWPSTTRAACIRPYKQFLVALDITKGATRYPTLVKWSHPADPGTFPVTWDEADPTKDAGEYPLSETSGHCIDCVPLRDTNLIYKQDSVWSMQYIGGMFVFKFTKVFGDFGVPNRDCVVEYQSGKHFVFTGNDLLIHDGQNVQSIATGRVRKLLKTITVNQLRTAFVALNSTAQEVWFCYRQANDDMIAADTAIVYNWADGSIGFRTLPNYRFIANGRLDPPITGIQTWDNVTGTWGEHPEEWGEAVIVPAVIRMVGLGELTMEWLEAIPYSSSVCWVERTYLGVPVKAGKAPDLSVQKFITRIWPRVVGTPGDVIRFRFGAADSVAKPIAWEQSQQYIIGVDEFLDCTLTGKMFAIRIESENVHQWTFNGMDAELIATGAN